MGAHRALVRICTPPGGTGLRAADTAVPRGGGCMYEQPSRGNRDVLYPFTAAVQQACRAYTMQAKWRWVRPGGQLGGGAKGPSIPWVGGALGMPKDTDTLVREGVFLQNVSYLAVSVPDSPSVPQHT